MAFACTNNANLNPFSETLGGTGSGQDRLGLKKPKDFYEPTSK